MINESRELHTTPSGTIRPFTWTASVARPRQENHAACASGVLDRSWDEARRRYGAAGELLARARTSLGRVEPEHLADEVAAGATQSIFAPIEQRQRDGEIIIDRNVLKWRLGPTSPDQLPVAVDADIRYVLMQRGAQLEPCDGDATELGLHPATDWWAAFRHCRPCPGAPAQGRPTLARRGRTASRRSHQ
jgi:hypothetical protein